MQKEIKQETAKIATRIRSRLPLRYCIKGVKDAPWKETITIDISSTGLLFESQELLPLFTILDVELEIPALERKMQLIARIVRAEEIERDKLYRFGVAIENMTDAQKEELRRDIELMDVVALLKLAAKKSASDLHLSANHPPIFRIGGNLIPVEMEALQKEDLERMIFSLLSPQQIETFKQEMELDTSISISASLRFRINVHRQRGNVEAAFRRIEPRIRTVNELLLPDIIYDFARKQSGLVLVTGATGAGKTTTLASMIDVINSERSCMVITLEDPVEYIHPYKKSVIKQREIGMDSHSFATALKHALRQDPDVILVGEVRDVQTMEIVLNAAETGHLVMATFPAPNAIQAVDRIIYTFPAEKQHQVKLQLSNCLQGIICQMLLTRWNKPGQVVVATEVLINTQAIANLIREGSTDQIYSAIQMSFEHGMHTMDWSLEQLYNKSFIDRDTVLENCRDKEYFLKYFKKRG